MADDEYSLRQPVWVKDLKFFKSGEKIVISTGYGQVRGRSRVFASLMQQADQTIRPEGATAAST